MQFFHIVTFGCQMNYADSARVQKVLEGLGMQNTQDLEQADVIIFNTCGVRQKAEEKVVSYQQKIMALKKTKNGLKWGLTGCMVRQTGSRSSEVQDALLTKLTALDFVFRIQDLSLLPEILGFHPQYSGDYLEILPDFSGDTIAYIPIMTGCNNFCTYCVVPYARGRERSRTVEDVLAECQKALDGGAKELFLLGQNVNSYEYGFPELLRKVNALPGEFWIRFTSSHPKDATHELFLAMAECEKVAPHLHLPVQAGCDATLARMNRKYTTEDYRKLVADFRALNPKSSLGTDWIVGFCGETEEEFSESLQFCEEIGFDLVYLAQYSPRPGTFAFEHLSDNISSTEKEKRWHRLNNLVLKTAFAKNLAQVGQEVALLVEKIGDGFVEGHTGQNKLARIIGTDYKVGEFVRCEVLSAQDWLLTLKPLSND